jgi:hypothetical protein
MWDCESCHTTNIAGSLEVCPHCQEPRYVAAEPGQPADDSSSTPESGDSGGAGLEPSPPGASAAASSSPKSGKQPF